MLFKTKLLVTRLIIFVLLILLMFFAYQFAAKKYRMSMHDEINREILIKQQNIANIISISIKNKNDSFGFYLTIHQRALQILKENPSIDLSALRRQLISEFDIPLKHINLFFVNSDKVVYDATLSKDIGFDLSQFSEPSGMIDKAFLDGGIHISKAVSQDVLDGSYKIYSYAKATDDSILEMSFVDDSASQIFRIAQQQDKDSHLQATLYTVFAEKDEFFYFQEGQVLEQANKAQVYQNAPKFNKIDYKADPIISAFVDDVPISFEDSEDNKFYYYANLFAQPIAGIEFDNIVVKYEISLKERDEFLQTIKRFFIYMFLLILLVVWLIHAFIKHQLVKPIDIITDNIRNRTMIPVEKLNNKNDEFFVIAKEYNHVFSELHKEIEKNARKVYIDSLTKIGNRKAFDEELEGLVSIFQENEIPFTMMLFDVDNFKQINDGFGHLMGDKVLQELSDLVKRIIRNQDKFYRVGGEEFVILLLHTHFESAIEVAQRVREEIASHFCSWETGTITISAGLCRMKAGESYESLYRSADNLLYQAKSKGKNQISFKLEPLLE